MKQYKPLLEKNWKISKPLKYKQFFKEKNLKPLILLETH